MSGNNEEDIIWPYNSESLANTYIAYIIELTVLSSVDKYLNVVGTR